MKKVIIVSSKIEVLDDIINEITDIDDNINIINRFSTDVQYKDRAPGTDYIEYIDNDELILAYRNNALICVTTKDEISTGISVESWINGDIARMTYEEYNNIPQRLLSNCDIVWYDNIEKHRSKREYEESKEFIESIEEIQYLYFTSHDCISEIGNIIVEYFNGDDIEKNNIWINNK